MNYGFTKSYEGKGVFIQILTVEVPPPPFFAELDQFMKVSTSELFVCHSPCSWFLTSLYVTEDYLAYWESSSGKLLYPRIQSSLYKT